jgi:hypothetical protein
MNTRGFRCTFQCVFPPNHVARTLKSHRLQERISPAPRRITEVPRACAGGTMLSEGKSWRNPFRIPPTWNSCGFLFPRNSCSTLVLFRSCVLWTSRRVVREPPALSFGVFSLRTDEPSIRSGWARCTHRLQERISPALTLG